MRLCGAFRVSLLRGTGHGAAVLLDKPGLKNSYLCAQLTVHLTTFSCLLLVIGLVTAGWADASESAADSRLPLQHLSPGAAGQR